MSVYLSVCLLVGLSKYYWLKLLGKIHNIGLGSTKIPFKFESDLDHHLDTKT